MATKKLCDVNIGDTITVTKTVVRKEEDRDSFVLHYEDGTQQTFPKVSDPAIETN